MRRGDAEKSSGNDYIHGQSAHDVDIQAANTEQGEVSSPTDEPLEGAPEAESPKKRSRLADFLISILSGNILSKAEVKRAYPYIIFLAFLAFIYIANVFRTQYLYREHLRLTEEVKELRSRSMTIASQKMIATRQSNIIEEINRRELKLHESLKPNKIIPRD